MNILHEADKVTSKDRQKVYGHPAKDFERLRQLTAPIIEQLNEGVITFHQFHSLYMIQVKIARLINTPDHEDSLVDIAGYARTYQLDD